MTKVALITAASKGMGAAIARRLHADGFEVALMSKSDGALALAKELGGLGFCGDVTQSEELKKFVNLTMEKYGRIDVVVNNTGHAPKGELLSISDSQWHESLDMMLLNVTRMAQFVVPIMMQQRGGAIVNISSAASVEPTPNFPVSSVIRASLNAYVKLFSHRYAKDNIRMNNVLPGMIDSYPESLEFLRNIPLGRYGTVAEIAATVSFLVNSESGFITGQSLCVDGGQVRGI
jgi:NAD(P)-dependent dehydrogenase (short-subunit alcohol dehydrogenase family)